MLPYCDLNQGIPERLSLLHLSIGCSEEQLLRIAAYQRHLMIDSIRHIADFAPTIYLIKHDQNLPRILAEDSAPALTLQVKGTALISAGHAAIDMLSKLNDRSTILLTGMETSREIFAAATDIMGARKSRTVIIREGVADSHQTAGRAAVAMLRQRYPTLFADVSIDRYQSHAFAIANDDLNDMATRFSALQAAE